MLLNKWDETFKQFLKSFLMNFKDEMNYFIEEDTSQIDFLSNNSLDIDDESRRDKEDDLENDSEDPGIPIIIGIKDDSDNSGDSDQKGESSPNGVTNKDYEYQGGNIRYLINWFLKTGIVKIYQALKNFIPIQLRDYLHTFIEYLHTLLQPIIQYLHTLLQPVIQYLHTLLEPVIQYLQPVIQYLQFITLYTNQQTDNFITALVLLTPFEWINTILDCVTTYTPVALSHFIGSITTMAGSITRLAVNISTLAVSISVWAGSNPIILYIGGAILNVGFAILLTKNIGWILERLEYWLENSRWEFWFEKSIGSVINFGNSFFI